MRALDLLGQALTRDANYGKALALAAHGHLRLTGWCDDQQQNRQEGLDLARRALQAAGDDPNVLVHVAHALGLFNIATGFVFPAHAHSWYPLECCSQQDCMPADAIEKVGGGGYIVNVDQLRIWAPGSFTPRPSPDDRVHICFHTYDADDGAQPICLFLPAEG